MERRKYRLVTRSDFDGLVCAALLRELDMINEIKFVHPKDMQDGKIPVTADDITTNLPYVEGVGLAFDHHSSEIERVGVRPNHIIIPTAPSAARVVFEHFGGAPSFPKISEELMLAVDKGDSAQYTVDEVLYPTGWNLMNFLMDSRTGLGRFRNFTISNYQLMMELIDLVRERSIDEILQTPNVKERVDLYFEQADLFRTQVARCGVLFDKLVVLDLRSEEIIHAGNRFMIYALFPIANISMHVMWGLEKRNTVLAIGKSIFDRSSPVNVGAICLSFGGGGHNAAGTCQVENDKADIVISELLDVLNDR